MNLVLIKKYKKEFEHALSGGSVLLGKKNFSSGVWKWYTFSTPEALFSREISTSCLEVIVIDDEFVEFRKALAEGKTVQYNFSIPPTNYSNYPTVWKDLDPKIGILSDRAHIKQYRIKPEEPNFKVGDWVRCIEDNDIFQLNKSFTQQLNEDCQDCELWHPKQGEWCWFNNEHTSPILIKYSYQDVSKCEPFIGELPTNLKK